MNRKAFFILGVVLWFGILAAAGSMAAEIGRGLQAGTETPHDGMGPAGEKPTQARPYTISITGNSFFSNEELLKQAADEIMAFERKGLRKADIDDAAFQMRAAYLREGFAFASVDYTYHGEAGTVQVTITVNEGSRVRINTLTFQGNRYASGDTLQEISAGLVAGRPAASRDLFVESDLKDAVTAIKAYYHGEGFADVAVEKPSLHFSADRSQVDITLTIAEGVRYLVREIVFTGDVLPELAPELEGLKKDLLVKAYYPRRKLLLQSGIKEIYDNHGYADADIDIQARLDKSSGKTVLEAAITSGTQVTIGAVDISGNRSTRDSFIRNRLQLKPGDIYSDTGKRESFRNLFDTGLFARIEIGLSPPAEAGKKNLEVKVVELPTREYYLEPGWGSYEQIRLRAGILEKNLFGTGRSGRLDGLVSAKGETFTLSYTDPWLLRTDIAMNVPLTYERREEPSYTSEKTEIAFLFTRKMQESLTVSAGYSFSKTVTLDLNNQEMILSGDDNYNKGTIGIQTVWDTRDNIFYPTAGLRLAAGLDLSLPALGSELDFSRLTFGCRYFIELPDTFILGLRATTGLIIPLQNQTFIPAGERFFNGGDNTVRSYEHSDLGPKDNLDEPIGGLGYNVLSVELRRRFYSKFVASIYADAGNISPNGSLLARNLAPYTDRGQLLDDTLNDFWRDFKFGVGMGLMYLLPVGPARIDIAYNPAPEKMWNEASWVFHFSLGMAF